MAIHSERLWGSSIKFVLWSSKDCSKERYLYLGRRPVELDL